MELNIKLSISENVDLELLLIDLCRRFEHTEPSADDLNFTRIDKYYLSTAEYNVLRRLLNSLSYGKK